MSNIAKLFSALTYLAGAILIGSGTILFGAPPARAQDPGPPEGIYAYAAGPTAIMVQWGSPVNAPDGFHVYRNNQLLVAIANPAAGSLLDNKGLAPNTAYTYKVCSVYSGEEFCTPDVTATTGASGGGGEGDYAPPTVTAVVAASYSLAFTWSSAPNYNFFQVRFARKGQQDNQTTLNQGGRSGSFTYQRLIPMSQYTFKVQGCYSQLLNSTCSTWTQVEAATKAPPPIPPSNFQAQSPNYTQINLTWNYNPTISSYHLYRTPGMQQGQPLAGTVIGYGDLGLNPTVTYAYRLCADSPGGRACATVSLNPQAPPPAPPPLPLLAPLNVVATALLANEAGVSWSVGRNSRTAASFEIDHRVGIAPGLDTGASPWTLVSGNVPKSANDFIGGIFLPLPSPLIHIFRVCAVDQWGRTCSQPVGERPLYIPPLVKMK